MSVRMNRCGYLTAGVKAEPRGLNPSQTRIMLGSFLAVV